MNTFERIDARFDKYVKELSGLTVIVCLLLLSGFISTQWMDRDYWLHPECTKVTVPYVKWTFYRNAVTNEVYYFPETTDKTLRIKCSICGKVFFEDSELTRIRRKILQSDMDKILKPDTKQLASKPYKFERG